MSFNRSFKSGSIALLGQPNVGKSTLINALLGDKISIVSPKAQTTRQRIRGILNMPGGQALLVDTPGLSHGQQPLQKVMRRTATRAAMDNDINLAIIDVQHRVIDKPETLKPSLEEQEIFKVAQQGSNKLVLVLNKIDELERKECLLPLIEMYRLQAPWEAVVPISARYGDGIDTLTRVLLDTLPPGEALFPLDMHTDMAERFMCSELIRQQLLMQTQSEVPHCAVVEMLDFIDERDNPQRPMCYLEARIWVERPSQKAIVIGRGGHQIKALGQMARRHIESLLGCRVFLKLTVHVDLHWTRNDHALQRHGLTEAI